MTGPDRSADWLKAGGLRPTRQRLALAELLVGDGMNRHVTAESLYALSLGADERVSLATVYNTLRAFCEMDEVGISRDVTETENEDGSVSRSVTMTDADGNAAPRLIELTLTPTAAHAPEPAA